MTAAVADFMPQAEPDADRREAVSRLHPRELGFAAGSLALHLLLFAVLLFLLPVPKPPAPPSESRVAVQILTPDEFRALLPPPEPELPTPAMAVPPEPPALPQTPESQPPEEATLASPARVVRPDGTIVARQFLSASVLADPRSADAKAALGQMFPQEKIVQLCVVEALAQIASLDAGYAPDMVASYAMANLRLDASGIEAPGAAFRSGGAWYNLTYKCALTPDLADVSGFEFRIGKAIPPEQWEDHNLVAGRDMDHH